VSVIPFWGEIPDDELARMFANDSDADLVAQWDDNVQCRAWDQVELIFAEQQRRAKEKAEAKRRRG
jgi:hypothetical protein